ncbi:MAG: folylpolyglutamate synthase/dihydrofolate synthase family protein [Pseudomonadota bacterium]
MNTPTSDAILERMMALHPKIIDLTLDRMYRLLSKLGDPHLDLPPVIHIAGTNGKGSTLAMIRAGLEKMGRSVHCYTSPHLVRFHERIRLNGSLISEAVLSDYLDVCYAANDGAEITYFEITTCAALLAFARTPADGVLLEVGLGGRLDATNVIERPAITVITPVDMDHQQFLGDTLAEIAAEKAGIIKPNVPCVVSPQNPSALEVIKDHARRKSAPLYACDDQWWMKGDAENVHYRDAKGRLILPRPNLPGDHQIQNAGAALAVLRHMGANDEACRAAVTQAEWPARMQRLRQGPLVDLAGAAELWLDGGHNPAAGRALAKVLEQAPPRQTHLICGMLNTKDIKGFLRPLAGQANSLHAVTVPGEAATLPASETARAAREVGLQTAEAPDVATALRQIVGQAPDARVLICGSLYLAGAVLRENA